MDSLGKGGLLKALKTSSPEYALSLPNSIHGYFNNFFRTIADLGPLV
jgi:hypothetical protein